MRSKDISGLAGVTPRALRHYHQIGLLPEPRRDHNGYRRYEISDLIRLLRIKGLAAAGVALGDIPSFLESRGGSADELLEALDRQLLSQINQLEQQRQMVAELRKNTDMPNAGPRLECSFGALTAGRSESSTEAWREQLTLFSNLLSREDLTKLYAIYERMTDESEEFIALGKKFDALGPESRDQEISELAKQYIDHFKQIFSDFLNVICSSERKSIISIMRIHTMMSVNESQKKMLNIVGSFMN